MRWQKFRPFLFPSITKVELGSLAGSIAGGAAVAGLYGILHDQVTYTLSPEYFHKLKFEQFRSADFGLPPRVFVAEIGFLASWWVGLVAGWVLGRISLVGSAPKLSRKTVWKAFGAVLGASFSGGSLGFLYGTLTYDSAPERWAEWGTYYDIQNLADFGRVGQVHLFGYLGGAVGLIGVACRLWHLRRRLSIS